MNRTVALIVAGLLLAVFAQTSARAETTEDIIRLSQKGLGEDVLLATVDRSEKGFNLSADDIIKLKQANVSEKVIAAMLRKKAAPAAQAVAPAKPAEQGDVRIEKTGDNGTLNLENVDDRSWTYRFDMATRILWISPAGEEAQKALTPHGGVSLSVPKGAYEVRYAGETSGQAFNVPAGEKALLLFSRVETDEFEGLYVSVFEKGERHGGGRLAVLRQTKKASQPQATYQKVPAPAQQQDPTYQYDPPKTQVVERVVEPSTTVIYRDPAPVYVYPSYPYYYGYPYRYGYGYGYGYPRYYTPYNSATFRYSNFGHHSGISVGLGFGW
ncbi:MAG: hypothetical protein HY291_15130 [Planctomycetes bacterium]|nr:hypothetical protein [Planctomycetota bacterium]